MQLVHRSTVHRRGPAFALAVASAAIVLLLGCIVALSGTRASAAPTLLSQGKPATASSTENADVPGVGAPSTATPAPAGPARSPIRSGSRSTSAQTATINQVVAELGGGLRPVVPDPGLGQRHDAGRPSTAPPPAPAACRRSPSPARGRYVRMNGTARATAYGYSLWEFQVYRRRSARPAAAAPPTRRRAARPPRRRPRTPTFPASAAVDGNAGTRWSSAFSDPQWLQVDLGAIAADLPGAC